MLPKRGTIDKNLSSTINKILIDKLSTRSFLWIDTWQDLELDKCIQMKERFRSLAQHAIASGGPWAEVVTNLSEERKRFYLIATQLDPPQNVLVLWQQILPLIWKDEGNGFPLMEFKIFYIQHTQGEVNHEDGPVHRPSALDDLLGVVGHQWMSTSMSTSIDVLLTPSCLHSRVGI